MFFGKNDIITKVLIALGFGWLTKKKTYATAVETLIAQFATMPHVLPVEGGKNVSFGDSFTNSLQATSVDKGYVSLLNEALNWKLEANGLSGCEIQDISCSAIWPTEVTKGSRFTLLSGYNDMRHFGPTNAVAKETFKRALTASVVWLLTPASERIKLEDSTRAAFSSNWTSLNLFSDQSNSSFEDSEGITAYNTTVSGSTLTANLQGTAVYVGWRSRAVMGSGGTFTITVDGVVRATIDTSVGSATGNAPINNYWPEVIRIGGLFPGNHNVVITSTNNSNVTIVYIGSNQNAGAFDWPFLFLGTTPRMNNAGYTASANATFNNGSDSAVVAYNAIISEVFAGFVNDGYNIYLAETSNYYNPNVPGTAATDNIHPSDVGYSQIADSFVASASGPLGKRDAAIQPVFKVHAGTTGSITINSPVGSVIMAAGAQTLVLTNSYLHVGDYLSAIFVSVHTDDATALTAKATVNTEGVATIKTNAAATANTRIFFQIK